MDPSKDKGITSSRYFRWLLGQRPSLEVRDLNCLLARIEQRYIAQVSLQINAIANNF